MNPSHFILLNSSHQGLIRSDLANSSNHAFNSLIIQGFDNLMSRISRLSALDPLAISVTWGAGGSTKDRSLELAGLMQAEGLSTILHLTCTNMEQGLVDDVLQVRCDWHLFFLPLLSITFKRRPKS